MPVSPVYIVVPVYNEEGVIRATVNQLLQTKHEIVIVDDGSSQNILSRIADLPVNYLRHEINLGQGAALQTGTEFALQKGAKTIVHFDADGQHDALDIQVLIEPLQKREADVVFGSRFIDRSLTKTPGTRKFLLGSARIINFLFTGILLTDAHNGLRALTSEAASMITLTENRMAHASEILFLVKKFHLRVKEVPVHIYYSQYSKSKGQRGANGIRIVFDLVLHKLFK